MKRIALAILMLLVLMPKTSFSQLVDSSQYFTVILTNKGGNEMKLVNLQVSGGKGHLVIIDLNGLWTSASLEVLDVGEDCTIEQQSRDKFLIKFPQVYGSGVNSIIAYTYDRFLRDMTVTQTVTNAGESAFTEWVVWRKNGYDQIPVTFLFPGIYPYFQMK
jgi:hypothetical protein